MFRWMYTIHRQKANEAKSLEAPKQISTISDAVKPKKNSMDFVMPGDDFDLRTILDRRTHTHKGSTQFIGVDNRTFQSEKPEKEEIP